MTRDAQLVLALLRTLLDWHPGPTTWNQNPLHHRPDSGEAPSATIDCPTCQGHGRRGKTVCDPCKGTGTITVDAYTEREVGTEHQRVTRVRLVRCDSCGGDGAYGNGRRCWHCDGTGTRTAAETLDATLHPTSANNPLNTLEDERKLRHHRTGSYTQLEQALSRLEREQPVAHSLLVLLIVYDSPAIASPAVQAVLDSACELLAAWMPKPIRVPEGARRQTQPVPKGNGVGKHNIAQRNETVRHLRAQGLSLAKIGQRMNLTKQRVSQILNNVRP